MPVHKSKAVIHSLYKAEDTIKVYVTKSTGIFDYLEDNIEDATIKLYKNDVFLETLTYDSESNYYKSENVAQINNDYQIVADIPGVNAISASSHTPKLPNLVSWEYIGEIGYADSESIFYMLKVEIDDDVSKRNYYEIMVNITEIDNEDYVGWGNQGLFNLSEPVFVNEENPKHLFSDDLFNGTNYTLNAGFVMHEDVNSFNLELVFRQVTKDYYNYKKKLDKHIEAQGGDDIFGYMEPVQMFSNINGGYGVFTGYSEVRQVIIEN